MRSSRAGRSVGRGTHHHFRCATAYLNRAVARKHTNDWEGVVADCSSVVELATTSGDQNTLLSARAMRAAACGRLGRFADTVTDCTEVISLAPKNVAAYRNRGAACMQLHRWEAAAADYTVLVNLEPTQAGRASAHGARAVAWQQLGRPDMAAVDMAAMQKSNGQPPQGTPFATIW